MKRVFGRTTAAVVVIGSLVCQVSAAAEISEGGESGFYVGASASRVEQDAQGEGELLVGIGPPLGFVVLLRPDRVEVDNTTAGWNVTLGYRVNRYFAAELAYHDFGEASVVERYFPGIVPFPSEITVRSSVEAYGPSVSLLGTLPVTPSLDIFARGGVLFLDQEIERQISSSRSTHQTGDEVWMVGAGVQWSFASRWAARVEYQLTDDAELERSSLTNQDDTNKIEQISLSVLFDF